MSEICNADAGWVGHFPDADPPYVSLFSYGPAWLWIGGAVAADIADGPREQFIKGNWDSLGQLLDAGDLIGETAGGLPYTNGFAVAG